MGKIIRYDYEKDGENLEHYEIDLYNINIKEVMMHVKGLCEADFLEVYRLINIEYKERLLK